MENRKRSFHKQNGASLIEYALLVSLIALAAIPSMKVFGANTASLMCKATTTGTQNMTYDATARTCVGGVTCGPGRTPRYNPDGSVTCTLSL